MRAFDASEAVAVEECMGCLDDVQVASTSKRVRGGFEGEGNECAFCHEAADGDEDDPNQAQSDGHYLPGTAERETRERAAAQPQAPAVAPWPSAD